MKPRSSDAPGGDPTPVYIVGGQTNSMSWTTRIVLGILTAVAASVVIAGIMASYSQVQRNAESKAADQLLVQSMASMEEKTVTAIQTQGTLINTRLDAFSGDLQEQKDASEKLSTTIEESNATNHRLYNELSGDVNVLRGQLTKVFADITILFERIREHEEALAEVRLELTKKGASNAAGSD